MPLVVPPRISKRLVLGSVLLLGLALALLLWFQRPLQPLRIGFIGGISGRVADLGMAGRDGAILAMEQRNAAGGIDGRRVELLVRDDQQDAAVAVQAVTELAEAGVVALIGPMTSAMAVAVAPVAERRQLATISPSASTTELTGIEDHFFRVYPDSSEETPQLAELAYGRLGLRHITIVCDLANAGYTLNWSGWFAREFARRGGTVAAEITFTSSQDTNFTALAETIATHPADGLLLLTNSIDTALLVQKVRQLGNQMQVLVSEWSTTEELLRLGGRAVNGIVFLHTFNHEHPGTDYQRFRDAFEQRFGYSVAFPAIKAYDAAQLLFLALDSTTDPARLREALRSIRGFTGLQNQYLLDEFGDVHQLGFVMTIRDGAFDTLDPG